MRQRVSTSVSRWLVSMIAGAVAVMTGHDAAAWVAGRATQDCGYGSEAEYDGGLWGL